MLPKAMLVVLTLIVDTTAFRLMAKLLDTPAELAVTVTFCAEPTAETDAVNPALVAPAATVTEAGTTIAVLLLDRLTLTPEAGAEPVS
jgi:hypothetical protein